jgi:hypothetical protein
MEEWMSYVAHDAALAALRHAAPEQRNGAPNHAPMVVEALAALGREDAVPRWIDRVAPRLAESPPAQSALGPDRQPALGDYGRLGEWQDLFSRELDAFGWRDVLERWLPRLVPGSMAAGTHGVIRCAHAVRALENAVTPLRLAELAAALAYCAARYRAIEGSPVLAGPLCLEAASRELPLLEKGIDRRGPPPKVVERLNERSDFAWAVSRLALPSDPLSALGELAEIGARFYLRDADRHPLVLLHAVTGPAAVHLLAGHVSPGLRSTLFAYMWQAVAAWAAAFSSGLAGEQHEPAREAWDEIIDLAVDSGDDHAIKLAEACHRMEGHRASPIFRGAASDWVHRVMEARDWSSERLVASGIRTRLSDGGARVAAGAASGSR